MKKYISLLIITIITMLSVNVNAYQITEHKLSDTVKPSEWAETEVNKALKNGLISDDTEYFYREYITREEFAELIVTCVEKLVDTKGLKSAKAFDDSANEQVLKAASMGIVSGIGDNLFAPKNNITRQEIAAMMYRAIKYVETSKGKTYLKNNTSLSGYSDSDKVSDWAREAVGTLVNNEIIFGTSDTTISPLANTTIEQAVLLDVRIYELMK